MEERRRERERERAVNDEEDIGENKRKRDTRE